MRLKQMLFLTNHMEITTTEKYSRGRRGAPAKGVGRATGARVQIPLSPLHFQVIIFLTLKWKNKNFCLTTTSKYDKVNTRLVKQERRTSKKFEKINKKVVDKQNNIWYTKWVAAETDNNKEPWKSKIEQYVKPWKFE